MMRWLCLAFVLFVDSAAWSMPTDNFVVASPGSHRAFSVYWTPGSVFIYDYGGARMNSEYAMRHVLPDSVTVNGQPTTVVRDAPQGYAEYWQFGSGARLLRIDEGDYNDQFGIGVMNRQNSYTPAIPVLPADAVVGSTVTASGSVMRGYNAVVEPQSLQFDSISRVLALETMELDGVSRQAFRVETAVHHHGQLIDTPNVDYTVTVTNLFVEGVGLIPVRTVLQYSTPTTSQTPLTILSYTPITPSSFTAAPPTFTARTNIPPGVAIDFNGASPSQGTAVPEVSVINGQFAGQEHPPSSFSILKGIFTVRTRAPATPSTTSCGALVIGQSAPGNFCVTTWNGNGSPQTGAVVFSQWGDFVGASLATYFPALFTGRRGSYWLDGVLNDKVYNMTFDGGSNRGIISFLLAMPDNDWPRRGRFNALTRSRASVGFSGKGCNQSVSDVLVYDIQYDADRNITAFAADVEQHCEFHPEALFVSLRFNSRVPYNTFASPRLSGLLRRGDFDLDFKSDILWRNSVSGENYVYPMNGTAILAGEGYLRTVADLDWKIAGIGDFDGDGSTDILWRHASTGDNYIYLMNGRVVSSEGYLPVVADQSWQVAGVGDFDGDGKADILWRNSATGENYIFFMDGVDAVAGGYIRTVADTSWQVAGVGDFDGDGLADILWRNGATGDNYLYPMYGLSVKASEGYLRSVANLSWKIAGVGDLNGDGRSDIVWRNSTTGENYVYLMNGASIAGEGYLRTVADQGWQVAAIGDYDGDGKSDLFWRNSATGQNYLYPMDGTAIKASEGYIRTVPISGWSVVGR